MSIFGRLDGSNFTSVLTNSDLINEEMKTDYYNKLETNNLLSNKSDTTHNHNSTYVSRTNGILDTSLNCNNQELNNITKLTSSTVNDIYIECTEARALFIGESVANNYMKIDGNIINCYKPMNLNNNNINDVSTIQGFTTSSLFYNVLPTYQHIFNINNVLRFKITDTNIESSIPLNMNNNNINNINTINGVGSLIYNVLTGEKHEFKVNNTLTGHIDTNSLYLSTNKYLNCNNKTKIQDTKIYVNEAINSVFSLTGLHENTVMVASTNTANNNATNIKIQNLHSVNSGNVQARIDFMAKNDVEEYWSGYLGCMKRGTTSDKQNSFLIAPIYSSNPNAYFEFYQSSTESTGNTLIIGGQWTAGKELYSLYADQQPILTTSLELKAPASDDTGIMFKKMMERI